VAKNRPAAKKKQNRKQRGERAPVELGPEQDELFEVERLLKHRKSDGHFLVKWKGYPASSNSWEPEECLPAEPLAAWTGATTAADDDGVDEEEGDDLFVVQRILSHRAVKGATGTPSRVEFKVRWKGFTAAHDSWEPTPNVDGNVEYLRYIKKNRL
jgi:hypothetical protein